MDILIVVLSLGTAVVWGLVVQLQRRGLNFVDGRTGALIIVLSFTGLFWLLAPFLIEWEWFTTRAALIFALSGIIVPGLAQQFTMLSIEKIGPAMTSVVAAFVPVFAIVPAILFLGEALNVQAGIGMALMVLGVVLAVQAKTRSVGKFSLLLIWLAIAAAAARGLGQPISKVGLGELNEPFFATLVMVTSAAVFISLSHLLRKRETIQFKLSKDILWLVAGGCLLGIGFLLLYIALSLGDVVLVAPFIATMPIWVIVFDHFVFKHERIGRWHMAAAVIVTVGSVILITR